jgi:ATP-dependent Clp protease protease subunit
MKIGELEIYDAIGAAFNGITPRDVADSLRAMGAVDQINVRINSPGGSVFDGQTIYNQLKRHPARKCVTVDGAACSIASLIVMAADPGQLSMAEDSWLMIHEPWARFTGTALEFHSQADLLEKMSAQIVNVYASRSGMVPDAVRDLFAQGDAWLSAREAVAMGLADQVTSGLAVAAHISAEWLDDVPETIRQRNSAIAAEQMAAKEARERLDKSMSERR